MIPTKRLFLLLAALLAVATAGAREVYPLNDGWQFFFKTENDSGNARLVSLPHSWNTDPMAGSRFEERTGHYLNEIYVPVDWSEKRLFLKCRGARSVADLFVNGRFAGEHRGGAAAFTIEITSLIRFGANNTLLMVVSNNFRSDVLPVSTDMNLYGGLYRGVELIVTDRNGLSPLYYGTEGVLVRTEEATPEEVRGTIEVHLLADPQEEAILSVELLSKDDKILFSRSQRLRGKQNTVQIPFSFRDARLWSFAEPNLYRVVVRFEEGDCRDSVTVRTGFRRIAIDEASGRLTLNGEPLRLRGVVLHHDNAEGGTLSDADYDEDLRIVRDLGATAIRSAVQPHGRYLYDRCDETGMLVWIDTPLQRAQFLSDAAYYATAAFEQNGLQQLQEIVAQNLNHPSVVMWGLFSDLRGVDKHLTDYVDRLNRAARAVDPSRPTVVTSSENGPLNFLSDGVIWRQQAGWTRGLVEDVNFWLEKLAGEWSHLASAVCYGFEGFADQQPDRYERPTRGPLELPERRQTRFHEEYASRLAADSLLWGWWIDGLSDYGSARRGGGLNGSGLVSFDRRTRKDAYYLYRALWNRREPTLHLAEKRWADRPAVPQRLTVYASEGLEPLLTVDGDTVALERYAPAIYRTAEIELGRESEAVVTAGALRDRALIRCGSDLKRPVPTDLLQTINRSPKD